MKNYLENELVLGSDLLSMLSFSVFLFNVIGSLKYKNLSYNILVREENRTFRRVTKRINCVKIIVIDALFCQVQLAQSLHATCPT